MFEFAFILTIVILAANIFYFVKNFREEKRAVEDKIKENHGAGNTTAYRTAGPASKSNAGKNSSANKNKSSKKKNYTYKK